MLQYLKLFVLLYACILASKFSPGQDLHSKDSLINFINGIRLSSDATAINHLIKRIEDTPEPFLLKNDLGIELKKLKKVLSVKDYMDVYSAYILRLLSNNSTASNERALLFGPELIQNLKQPENNYAYYSSLWLFRELRSAYRNLGRLNESLAYYGWAERDFIKLNDSDAVSIANNVLSGNFFRLGLQERAIYHQGKSIAYLNDRQDNFEFQPVRMLFGIPGKLNRYGVLSQIYLKNNKIKEADSCLNIAFQYYKKLDSPLQHFDVPFLFMQKAIIKSIAGDTGRYASFDTCYQMMRLYTTLPPYTFAIFFQERAIDFIRYGVLDSAAFYLKKVHNYIDSFQLGVIHSWGQLTPEIEEARVAIKREQYVLATKLLRIQIAKLEPLNLRPGIIEALELLADTYYTMGKPDSAFLAIREASLLKNQLIADEKEARTVSFDIEKQLQENETAIMLLNARDEANKRTRLYLFGIISLLGLLAIALAYFYRNKQKTGRELQSKNEKLEQALIQLKSTQSQLIQSEKMAGLGELTAGIAHEIQNPLNFVNNFSEVSKELINELSDEVDKGNYNEVKAIAKDVVQNLEKINHHGKRADAIVKGMLAHSRTSSGQKEPTDLNALCDEYLRLAYHGLRAKDNAFNAAFKTYFDPNIGNINIVPQDIGRVLLNLINNAFYAVNERSKMGEAGYIPEVEISTAIEGSFVKVMVKDNGGGIPEHIKEKIFQPFFTTKPTGQGTGLGLSLSYDIITKGHQGELKVETEEGKGSKFIIHLPNC